MAGFVIGAPSGAVVWDGDELVVDTAGVRGEMLLRGDEFQPRYGLSMMFDVTDRLSTYWAAMTVLGERHPVDDIAVRFDDMPEPELDIDAPDDAVF